MISSVGDFMDIKLSIHREIIKHVTIYTEDYLECCSYTAAYFFVRYYKYSKNFHVY